MLTSPGFERAAAMGGWLLNVAFPPCCPACHGQVSAQDNFCAECFAALRQISAPQCDCCGIPFAFDAGLAAQCPECIAQPPSFDSARAPLIYDTTSAPLIRSLKFHDRYTGLRRATAMMVAALGARREAIELIVPVPLHWRRLAMRRFNQSALIGYALSRAIGISCAPQTLKRTRYTTPQMRLPRDQRLKNVRDAFAVAGDVAGKTILLVDDVVTTGATVQACAVALKKAGALQVHVLALARTVKE